MIIKSLLLSLTGSLMVFSQNQIIFQNSQAPLKNVTLTPEMLVSAPKESAHVASPLGDNIVYISSQYNISSGKTTQILRLISNDWCQASFDGQELTSFSDPTWISNDQLILLASNKDYNVPQLYTIKIFGKQNECKQFGDYEIITQKPLEYRISHLKWVSGANMLAFTSEVYPYGESTMKEALEIDQIKKKEDTSAQVFDKLYIRHWDTFEDGKVSHVFSVKVDSDNKVDIDSAVNWMKNHPLLSTPVKPFPDASHFTFSPDGKQLFFSSMAHLNESKQAWSTNLNIYKINSESKDTVAIMSGKGQGAKNQPQVAHGKLFWVELEEAGNESDDNILFFCDLDDCENTKEKVLVSLKDTYSIKSYFVHPRQKVVIFTMEYYGEIKLYLAHILQTDGNVKLQQFENANGMSVSSIVLDQNTQTSAMSFHIVASSLSKPPAAYRLSADQELKQVTYEAVIYFRQANLGQVGDLQFLGTLEDQVYGFEVLPPHIDPSKKYPVAFLIHGGPESSWLNQWSYRWNPQAWAAQGYVTYSINFHGSTGYGTKFREAIRGNWGGYPYQDLMMGLDVIVKKPYIDSSRVYGLGASYGGFMINWINGHTDRFKCLVNHDGVFDTKTMWFTTEELYFNEWEFLGTPWESKEVYEKWNPSAFVDQWKTPTLIIHGNLDYRVPIGEGIGAFTALQRRGIKSRFLYFPDENHWVLKSGNSLRWHQEIFKWLKEC